MATRSGEASREIATRNMATASEGVLNCLCSADSSAKLAGDAARVGR